MCVSLPRVKVIGSSGKQPCEKGWYEVFHVKWPINGAEVALKCVMFAHTLSQTHIHTQTSTHWLKRPIFRLSNTSATHTPVPMYTRSQTHTAAGTKPEALTLIVSWLSLRISQVQYWTLTHTYTRTCTHTHKINTPLWRSVKRKMFFFFILILHFQKDPAVLSRSPPFLDFLPFLAKIPCLLGLVDILL